MMKFLKIAVLLFTISCNSKPEQAPTLDKAHQVHLEAVNLYDQAHQLYDSLKKEAKAKTDSVLLGRLDSIHDLMHDWEEGLYEVPGYKHSHHDHDHKHEHKTAPKMTDESMLHYQETARDAISGIKEALKGFKIE